MSTPGPRASCTAIVPFRPDGAGERTRNLSVVLRWLDSMSVDHVLAVHGPSTPVGLGLSASTRVVHVVSDGPFCKSAACNAAVRASDSEVLALVDADTLMDGATLLGCVTRVLDGIDVIRPFDQLVSLDAGATEQVRAGADPTSIDPAATQLGRPGEVVPLCGGIVVLRTDAYERAGGMDETIVGWGGEDDALSAALLRTGSDARILRGTVAYHLWHRRDPATQVAHAGYRHNVERARWWQTASDDEVRRAAAAGRARLRARDAQE